MSIRSRILIPMIVISVLTASAILFFNVVQFSSFVEIHIEDELSRAVLKVRDEIEGLKSKSHTAALYFAEDDALIAAMERGDHRAVLKRTQEMYAQTDIESLTVVDSNAIVMARAHNPEMYGDDTSVMSVVRAALDGRPVIGAERGISTSISVRASTPIYNDQGVLIGALFAGDRLDTEQFVDRMKTFTGCEITLIVDDERVATTLLDDDNRRMLGPEEPEYIVRVMSGGTGSTRRVGIQGSAVVEMHTPVVSGSGDIIGIISVGRHLTEKQEMVTSFIAAGALITSVFIIVSVLIILFVSGRIAEPISQSINLANYDKLTGIFNRRYFEERLELLLKTMSRSGGTVSLLMIDIDFFKNYNDTYGHIKGDDCLRAVAGVLTQTVSRADDFVARYGGEEFVVVLPNTGEPGARLMAERLLTAMRECCIPHEKSDVCDHVTISIGVATERIEHVLTGRDLIKKADSMLYESKRNGRDMYSFSSASC